MDVNQLFCDDKFAVVVDDYHDKLKGLFGEANYGGFIDTLQFVLTHNDQSRHSKDAVAKRLRQLILSALQSETRNPQLAEFANRMSDHHILVDYDQQDGRMLLEQLNAATGSMESEGPNPAIDHNTLDVHANKLNANCVRTLINKTRHLEGTRKKCEQDIAERHQKVQGESLKACDAAKKLHTSSLVECI